MDVNHFIQIIEEEFEDIKPGTVKPETVYREAFEWNSINALIMIALVDTEYDVSITADDLIECKTIQQLFDRIKEKQQA